MVAPATVAASVGFSVDKDHHPLFDLPLVASVGPLLHASAVERETLLDGGPPVDDLVITLRHLLI